MKRTALATLLVLLLVGASLTYVNPASAHGDYDQPLYSTQDPPDNVYRTWFYWNSELSDCWQQFRMGNYNGAFTFAKMIVIVGGNQCYNNNTSSIAVQTWGCIGQNCPSGDFVSTRSLAAELLSTVPGYPIVFSHQRNGWDQGLVDPDWRYHHVNACCGGPFLGQYYYWLDNYLYYP